MWFRPSLFLNKIGQDWTLLTFVKEKKWGEREKKRWPGQELLLRKLSIKQGLCRSRKKSQNFVGFLETNLQQNCPILRKAHSAEIFWANLLESNRFCADFTNVFNETRRNFAHFWWEGKWWALACAITTETLTTINVAFLNSGQNLRLLCDLIWTWYSLCTGFLFFCQRSSFALLTTMSSEMCHWQNFLYRSLASASFSQ